MEEVKFTVKLSQLIDDFKLEKLFITPEGENTEITNSSSACVHSCFPLFGILWTVAGQAPLYTGFLR